MSFKCFLRWNFALLLPLVKSCTFVISLVFHLSFPPFVFPLDMAFVLSIIFHFLLSSFLASFHLSFERMNNPVTVTARTKIVAFVTSNWRQSSVVYPDWVRLLWLFIHIHPSILYTLFSFIWGPLGSGTPQTCHLSIVLSSTITTAYLHDPLLVWEPLKALLQAKTAIFYCQTLSLSFTHLLNRFYLFMSKVQLHGWMNLIFY